MHPDKNPNKNEKATQLFKQVKEAYECLKYPYSRALYDGQQGIAQNRAAFAAKPTKPPKMAVVRAITFRNGEAGVVEVEDEGL